MTRQALLAAWAACLSAVPSQAHVVLARARIGQIIDCRQGLLILIACALLGCTDPATGVVVEEPWARPTAPVATVGAAYLSITNHGASDERLLSASSPVAGRVELHASSTEGGVMRMRPVERLHLGSQKTVAMNPGGLHLMLLDLTTPLVAGSRFPLTLNFETAGAITVDVLVQQSPISFP